MTKNQVGKFKSPDFKLYYKSIVIKVSWHWRKDRYINQWNRTESPETDPNLYGQLIFGKGVKEIHNEKNTAFSTNGATTARYPYRKKVDLDSYFRPPTKV